MHGFAIVSVPSGSKINEFNTRSGLQFHSAGTSFCRGNGSKGGLLPEHGGLLRKQGEVAPEAWGLAPEAGKVAFGAWGAGSKGLLIPRSVGVAQHRNTCTHTNQHK